MGKLYLKTEEEIEKIRKSSLLVGEVIAEVAKLIAPGVKTIDLDKVAEQFIRDNKAIPAFKGYRGFPASLCISVNDAVVHGIPGKEELKEGDVVSIDCGVKLDGWYGDSAYTFGVGNISPEIKQLLDVTKQSLYEGIRFAVSGMRIGDISFAVQNHAEKFGYGVVRELVGHGIGRNLHEEPEVPNYGRRGNGVKCLEGMVIAIEPMINMGSKNVYTKEDRWTIGTSDGKPSAHFEHTVCIRKGQADILSSFAPIEEVEKIKNK
ncbi:MAG: type I methionyl aminopeptidase [Bacteroidia bacterium]|nr:type I methionyl aminopeptidase [Bacteroidia bacterium]